MDGVGTAAAETVGLGGGIRLDSGAVSSSWFTAEESAKTVFQMALGSGTAAAAAVLAVLDAKDVLASVYGSCT